MRTRLREEARVIARELLRRHEQVCSQLGANKPENVTDGMIDQSRIAYGVLCERAGTAISDAQCGALPW